MSLEIVISVKGEPQTPNIFYCQKRKKEPLNSVVPETWKSTQSELIDGQSSVKWNEQNPRYRNHPYTYMQYFNVDYLLCMLNKFILALMDVFMFRNV